MSVLKKLLYLFGLTLTLSGCLGGGNGSHGSEEEISTTPLLIKGTSLRLLPDASTATVATTLIALLKDGNNTPIAEQTVTFSFVGDNNETLTPSTALTNEEGIAEVTVTDLEGNGGTVVVKASAGDLSAYASIDFLATFGEDRQLSVETSGNVLTTGQQATVTATITNSHQLPIIDQTVNFSVRTIEGKMSQAKLSQTSGLTDANGQITVFIKDAFAENLTVTVRAGTAQQKIPLYFGATLQVSPTSVHGLADGSTPVELTATIKDAKGSTITGLPIDFRVIEGDASLSLTRVITDESGQALVSVTSNAVGAVKVAVSAGELPMQIVDIDFAKVLVDERVSNVQIIVNNDFAHAYRGNLDINQEDTIIVTVIVRDDTNTPLTDVEVSLQSDSNSAAFSTLHGFTDESGRFITEVTNTTAEAVNVTALVGGSQEVIETITFIARANAIELTANKIALKTGEKATVTVKITEEGTPVRSTFAVNLSGSAQLLDKPEMTDTSGHAELQLTSAVAEEVTVTVISGTARQTLTLYFGASLTLVPTQINAIGETTLTALLRKGNGAPLPEQTIAFSFSQSGNETLNPASATTADNGIVDVVITDLGADGGQVTVNASSGSLTAQATVNFLADLGQGRQLAAKSSATVLSTNQSTTITATIEDDVGVPVVGQLIRFTALSPEGETTTRAQVRPAQGTTDAQGSVKATISNAVKENVVIQVSAGTATQEIPLYFGATLSLTPPQASGTLENSAPVELIAHVKDANQQGIAGATVNLRVTAGEGLLDVFQPITDERGQVIVQVTSRVAGETLVQAQTDSLTASSTINFTRASNLQRIELETSPDEPIILPLNGQATIVATVWDEQGSLVEDGTLVNFETTGGAITNQVLTQQGEAEAIFEAGTKAGVSEVTVASGNLTKILFITVQSDQVAGIIEVDQIDPPIIGVAGSGISQTATVQFLVKDNLGNAVVDGTEVTFSLGATTLGGGETISTGERGDDTKVSAKTRNGLVSVVLKSGLVAGNVDIIARVGEVSTVARITIVSSTPDAEHFSLALEYLNIAGGVKFGLQDEVTAYVGDRFGNIVPDGTAVSFITEGGTIGKSVGGGAFTSTTEFGQATAILQSAAPTTPNLGGAPALSTTGIGVSFECDYPYQDVIDSFERQHGCGNPGRTTIVAYTTGSESFVDVNGNGRFDEEIDRFYLGYRDINLNQRWDMGEIITGEGDLSEPYIDSNDNRTFDPSELYVDVNSNGQFDGPDGHFQENTTIWRSIRVLFSARTAPFKVASDGPIPFTLHNDESQTFFVSNISDQYGNALVGGSRFVVTTSSGELGGVTDIVLEDSNGSGESGIVFTLASSPPTFDTDIQVWEYPPPSATTITIQILSPITDSAPGGNGNSEKVVISGTVNVSN